MMENINKTTVFFREAEHFLQHFALVSKILWPADKAHNSDANKRGRNLRVLLKLKDCSKSQYCRNLRNDIEHFDERLDSWVKNAPGHILIDKNICNKPLPSLVKGACMDNKNYLRNFNPATNIYSFTGNDYNILEMKNNLLELLNAVENSELPIKTFQK